MLRKNHNIVFIILLAFVITIMYFMFCKPSGLLLSCISQSPLKVFIHYRWDVSKTKDKSVEAVLECKNDQFTISISGNGEMIDFDSYENQIAWHELQSMSTGWFLQPNVVTIESGIYYIWKYAFSDFSLLNQINLPPSLKKISNYAFLNCTSLNRVIYNGTVEEWNRIEWEDGWRDGCAIYEIECINGIIEID